MPLTPEQLRRIEEEEQQHHAPATPRERSAPPRRPAADHVEPERRSGRRRGFPHLAGWYVLGFIVAALAAWIYAGTRPSEEDAATRSRIEGDRNTPAYGTPLPNVPEQRATENREPQTRQAAPEPAKQAPPEEERARANETVPGGRTEGVRQLLDRWVASTKAKDLQTQADLYADVVERFYNARNISRSEVLADRRRMFETYPRINRYAIDKIRIESNDGRRASVTFDKHWDTAGQRRFSGSERQRLVLQHTPDGWKIVREEELRVYRVSRG